MIDFGGGTVEPYVVINVKNLNTGKTKEICTYTGFLEYALQKEYKKENNDSLLRNKQRYFELKDTAALYNIGFDSYSSEDLKKFKEKIKFDSIFTLISKKQFPNISFGENHNELNMFAHLLFNKGILSAHNSCFCAFKIIDDKDLEDKKKRISELIEITEKAKKNK